MKSLGELFRSSEPMRLQIDRDGEIRMIVILSRRGRASQKKWLLAGIDPNLVWSATDPIRSRMFFLDLPRAAKQAEFVDNLIDVLECYLAKTRDHLENISDADVKMTEARLYWLRFVRDRLPPP
jgi:hypothetical protein